MKAGWKPSDRHMKRNCVQWHNPVIRRKGSSLRLLEGQILGGDLLEKHPAFICFSSNVLSREWSYNTVQITSDIFGSGFHLTSSETVSTILRSHSAALRQLDPQQLDPSPPCILSALRFPACTAATGKLRNRHAHLPQGDKTLQLLRGTPQQV